MATIPTLPNLGFELGISPTSGASNGLDFFGDHGGGMTGSVHFGPDGTAISPVIKDIATAIAVFLGAVWIWKNMK